MCEFSILVVAGKHLVAAQRILPSHWGILTPVRKGSIAFEIVKKPELNKELNRTALIKLLWKTECASILKEHCNLSSLASKASVIKLWELMDTLPTETLVGAAREQLKRRQVR